MAKIFISYSHKNKELANTFAQQLKDKNNEVFIDSSFLNLGSAFRSAISKQIKASDGFVALLTKEGISADYVIGEIGSARLLFDDNLILIIALINPGIAPPEMIRDLIFAEMNENNYSELVEKVHRAVEEFLPKKSSILNALNSQIISGKLLEILKSNINRYDKYRLISGSLVGMIIVTLFGLTALLRIPLSIYIEAFVISIVLSLIFVRCSTCLKYCQLAEIVCLEKDVRHAIDILKESPCMKLDTTLLLKNDKTN